VFVAAHESGVGTAVCASASALRALVVHPDLLLMDEPFSALDVLTAETLRTDLVDLWIEAGCRSSRLWVPKTSSEFMT